MSIPAAEPEIDTVYQELRKLAAIHLRRSVPNPTLQPTSLVHEAWLRLGDGPWKSRTHFLAVASRVMRNVLIDSARARLSRKRGGGEVPTVSLSEATLPSKELPLARVLDLDTALNRLSEASPRRAQVVEMRFFGGMEFAEIAETLSVFLITVKRDWEFSRAWLYRELSGPAGAPKD